MKYLSPSVLLSVLLIPSIAFAVELEDLVKRDGRFYQTRWLDSVQRIVLFSFIKKVTAVPFTGEVTGTKKGALIEGKQEGPWISYYDNGQLQRQGSYKN